MDESLFIEQINKKDPKAFHNLFESFYNSLVAFASGYVDTRQTGEDIVQEFFIQLWENKCTFPNYNHLRNYLYISVRNTCLNYLKHCQVEQKYIDYSLLNPEDDDIDLKIAQEELYRLLFRVIEDLPARRKEIFQFYMQGKTNAEIAELLKISVETVKTAKKEAVCHIRKHMGHLFHWLVILGIIS